MNHKISQKIHLEKHSNGYGYYVSNMILKDELIFKEKAITCVAKAEHYETMMNILYNIFMMNKTKILDILAPIEEVHTNDDISGIKFFMSKCKNISHKLFMKKLIKSNSLSYLILCLKKISRNVFESESKILLITNGAKFNHSCVSNVDYVVDHDNVIFSANKNVDIGEELTITYIDPDDKHLLQEKYNFICNCESCKN